MPRDELRGDKLIVEEDPAMTRRANELLAEDMREATAAREVELRPSGQDDTERGAPGPTGLRETLWESRGLLGITFGVLVVIGAIIAVGTGRWWVLGVALLVHFAVTTAVVAGYLRDITEVEHAEPTTAAHLKEEGVADPDAELSRRLSALRDGEGEAVAEQRESWTPASGANPPEPGGGEDRVQQDQRRR